MIYENYTIERFDERNMTLEKVIAVVATRGTDYDPIPAGMHQSVCFGIYDLGVQPSNNPAFSDAHKVLLTFELPHERMDFEKDGVTTNQPRVSSKEYTLSIGDKANLKRDLVSWRGREFTPEEKESFDISVLAGNNLRQHHQHQSSLKGHDKGSTGEPYLHLYFARRGQHRDPRNCP